MAQPASIAAEDRLPWLTEVPRAPPPEPQPRRRAPLAWLAGGILALGIGAGGWWLATRGDDAPPRPVAQSGTELPLPPPADEYTGIPSVSDMTAADDIADEAANQVAAAEPPAQTSEPEPQPSRREPVRRPRQPRAGEAAERASPVPDIPAQPVVRGRIIQIGAYPTKERADEAWRYVVKRWPYLATKPKLVSPIEVQSTDGKGTRMYRLQLATTSQAQSAVICQQLEASKTSCVVVY